MGERYTKEEAELAQRDASYVDYRWAGNIVYPWSQVMSNAINQEININSPVALSNRLAIILGYQMGGIIYLS